MKTTPTKEPISQDVLSRVVQGVKYMLTGKPVEGWFSPGDPLAPQAQKPVTEGGARGRQFDFPVGVNTRRNSRDGEGVSFAEMRALADGYDLLRLVIETRKDQMSKMRWTIGLKEEIVKARRLEERQVAMVASQAKTQEHNAAVSAGLPAPGTDGKKEVPDLPAAPPPPDPRIAELTTFFSYPDQEHDWETWLRALLEDLFVLDAPTVFPRETLDGGLYALELVDGATVNRMIDQAGRTPLPPAPAYQQILKGMPAVNYHRDELIYRPRNVRTNKVYGYGPVEQVIMTVNIAMRRQLNQLQYYTEGNVPEALIGVPEDWNPDQIAQFQLYWDSIMEGNTANRQHAKFVPGGMTPTFTRPNALKDEFDEWLARILCFAFSLSPQALVKQMNRATAETANDTALAEGLVPIMNWVRGLVNYVIWKYFGYTDIEFKWEESDETSPETQMKVLTGYKAAGIMDADEVRDKLGMDPLSPEQKEALKPPPTIMPPGEEDKGGTGKPVGKTQGLFSRLLKGPAKQVKPLSRNRKACTTCTSALTALMGGALTAMAKHAAKTLRIPGAVNKATFTLEAKALIAALSFSQLQDIAPEVAMALEDMVASGGSAALAQVLSDITADQLTQVNAYAVEYAQARAAELMTGIEESTRDMLRTTVQEALEQGWSNDALADALQDNYAFSDARAEMVARTETAYADIQGNLEGYKQSGVVQGKQWIIAQDEICDDCTELHLVIVGLGEDFPNGGDGPPLHPNCRCDVIPVLFEED